uniref:Dynein light chain Tctex-type 1 n=1 Tax=Spongospora subterranea TaxID=70186 RepID=A0A0H5QWL2_9EUKA|eukprot:CRZ06358.1 hypothetical protein [Spongospora subterranea]
MKLTNCRLSSRVCKGQLGQAPLAIYFSLILVLDILHTCINHHLTPEMDDLNKSEQLAFSEDEVGKIINETLDGVLNQKNYDEKMVPRWTSEICETLTQKLVSLRKPFKYIVTCVIMQRNGAAIHSGLSCYWDSVNDGLQTILWPKDRSRDSLNRTMYCIASVFAVGI